MPTTVATLVYSVVAQGATPAAINAALAAVPRPDDILDAYGVTVLSDVTAGLARTIRLALVPAVDSTATAHLIPGNAGSGSPIDHLTPVVDGGPYAWPPDIKITDPTGKGASANVKLSVVALALVSGGIGYATPPTVTFVGGGLAPGGVQATATATVLAGAVNALFLTTFGTGYSTIPNLLFTGGGGSGAKATAAMKTSGLTLLGKGTGYTAPVVTFTPHFKSMFPDAGDQRAPFWNLMKQNIQRQLACPVFAAAPVIT